MKGEGHFIALFEKDQDDSYRGNSTYSFKSYRPDEDFIAFIKHVSESAGIKTDRIEENREDFIIYQRECLMLRDSGF